MTPAAARRRIVLEALEQWNLKPDALQLRHHGENTVYVLRSSGDRLIARLSGTDLQTPVSVRGEVRFIEHVAQRGINTARPIPTASGDLFAKVSEQVPATGKKRERMVTLFPYLPGRRVVPTKMTPETVFQWGAFIAQLQNATASLRQTRSARRPRWDEINFQARILGEDLLRRRWFVEEWEILQNWMRSLPETDFGLIHSDVHEGNFKIHRGEFQLFDFDDSCVCWYAYDFAAVLLRVKGNHDLEWWKQFRAQLLAGYRSVRHLSEDAERWIPGFIRMRRLFVANWLTTRADVPRLRRFYDDYLLRLRFAIVRETDPLA